MPTIRLATFNCENLFARFKFAQGVDPATASSDGFTVNQTKFDFLNEAEKELTARAIREIDADLIALMEVDNHEVLKRFRTERLDGMKYAHTMLVDANDPRRIDVAILSRFPIVAVRSYQHLKDGSQPLFSRDCLEADVLLNGSRLTLFVNHFKSMLDLNNPSQGRKTTRAKRVKQAAEVKAIVQARFGTNPGGAAWAVIGDLNDFLGAGQGTTSGITDLVTWSEVENVVDRLPSEERWTHFFERAPAGDPRVRQLDYILLSTSLAAGTTAVPVIERRGLSTKAMEAPGPRFPGVTAKTVASDHCPVAIDITV
jgi:endonuclease/exonuclease/phosphatase family metal-dependent hydrolase